MRFLFPFAMNIKTTFVRSISRTCHMHCPFQLLDDPILVPLAGVGFCNGDPQRRTDLLPHTPFVVSYPIKPASSPSSSSSLFSLLLFCYLLFLFFFPSKISDSFLSLFPFYNHSRSIHLISFHFPPIPPPHFQFLPSPSL